MMHFDLEYDHILMCAMRGRAGQIVGTGFSGKKTQLGVKMSKTVKKVGCLNLKTFIEDDKLVIPDYDTIVNSRHSFQNENRLRQKKDVMMTLRCV
jgi:hypothetical protein